MSVLMGIFRADVGMVVWTRAFDPDDAVIRPAATVDGFRATASGRPGIAARSVRGQWPRMPKSLADDIIALTELYAALAGVYEVDIDLTDRPRAVAAFEDIGLICRYGGDRLRWWDTSQQDDPAAGQIEPFSVALLKGRNRTALHDCTIRLGDVAEPARAGGSGMTLTLTPSFRGASPASLL